MWKKGGGGAEIATKTKIEREAERKIERERKRGGEADGEKERIGGKNVEE